MSRSPQKIALILDSTILPAWKAETIRCILNIDSIQVTTLIVFDPAMAVRTGHSSPGFLYRLFRRIDDAKRVSPDAISLVDISDMLEHINADKVQLGSTGDPSQSVAESAEIQRFDAIVNLSSNECPGELAKTSRCGLWRIQHAFHSSESQAACSVGTWEVIKGLPFTCSALTVRTNDGHREHVVSTTRSGVNRVSQSLTRNEHLWKLASLLPRALRRLGAGENILQTHCPIDSEMAFEEFRSSRRLTNVQMFYPLSLYYVWRFFRKFLKKRFVDRWELFYHFGENAVDLRKLKQMSPPTNRFWADPHIIQRDGRYYVFFEDADIFTGHGHIAVFEISSNGQISQPKPVLERPYHLSYPFIFEWNDSLYMIPESAENQTIEVYQCQEFPYVWKHHANIMEGVSAYDSTLFEKDGVWWMFANIKERDGASSWDELHLFYADHPLSANWTPHPKNPIVTDVSRARPAGPMFYNNGRLIRPSQNSSNHYGYGLNMMEIQILTMTDYRERMVDQFLPEWSKSAQAIHSYSRSGDLTFVDAIWRNKRSTVTS